MMILHGHNDDAGKEDQIRPAECAKGEILRNEGGGGHQKNADPDAKEPNQADIIRGLSLNDPHDERDIEDRQ